MGLDNHIESAMKGILKNPILSVLREIKITNILKQSDDAYSKDTYYRFIQSKRYNWRKLLYTTPFWWKISLLDKVGYITYNMGI